jgi:glutamate formiminotransferase
MKILGAVPNVSEGKDVKFIQELVDISSNYEKLWVISKNIDDYYNRTMISVAGEPNSVVEYLFELTKVCSSKINLNKHRGSYPRIGAVDVIPLIPITSVSDEEALELANSLGKRIADELTIPVYFYEKSTNRPSRKHINYIRAGEFEKLSERMKQEEWKPDFGPAHPHPTAGTTIVGVREFLITLNFYIDTKNRWMAEQIRREVIIEIPGSVFLDHDDNGYYILTVNASARDINLFDLINTTNKIIEHFECKLYKFEIPTPLTSKILSQSLKSFVKSAPGDIKTIEEYILKEM